MLKAETVMTTSEYDDVLLPDKAVNQPKPAKLSLIYDFCNAVFKRFISIIPFFTVSTLLYIGWQMRGEEFIIPDSGVGYYLGITGSVMMILLLLYPARKMCLFMRNWGAIKYWFRAHMILGTIAPILILFHANFRIGSLNSQVVLASTLIVSLSGFVGRYIYIKVNDGLYGSYTDLSELRKNMEVERNSLAEVFSYAPLLKERIMQYENIIEMPASGFFYSLVRVCCLNVRTSWTHFFIINSLKRAIYVVARREYWTRQKRVNKFKDAKKIVSSHMNMVLRIAEFNFFERLLSLWHLLHLPLFILLIFAAIVHICAVHIY